MKAEKYDFLEQFQFYLSSIKSKKQEEYKNQNNLFQFYLSSIKRIYCPGD